jgi:hypothetical protein
MFYTFYLSFERIEKVIALPELLVKFRFSK